VFGRFVVCKDRAAMEVYAAVVPLGFLLPKPYVFMRASRLLSQIHLLKHAFLFA
jgi:hypothetical protein